MINTDREFVYRAYSFGELASLYCPDIAPQSASKMLRKWIRETRDLQAALEATGWRPYAKMLSPKMVACLVTFLGEP